MIHVATLCIPIHASHDTPQCDVDGHALASKFTELSSKLDLVGSDGEVCSAEEHHLTKGKNEGKHEHPVCIILSQKNLHSSWILNNQQNLIHNCTLINLVIVKEDCHVWPWNLLMIPYKLKWYDCVNVLLHTAHFLLHSSWRSKYNNFIMWCNLRVYWTAVGWSWCHWVLLPDRR